MDLNNNNNNNNNNGKALLEEQSKLWKLAHERLQNDLQVSKYNILRDEILIDYIYIFIYILLPSIQGVKSDLETEKTERKGGEEKQEEKWNTNNTVQQELERKMNTIDKKLRRLKLENNDMQGYG